MADKEPFLFPAAGKLRISFNEKMATTEHPTRQHEHSNIFSNYFHMTFFMWLKVSRAWSWNICILKQNANTNWMHIMNESSYDA